MMRRTFFIYALILAGLTINAQHIQTRMQIAPMEHNFGVFREEAGRQTFDFIVTNSGSSPLIIQNVIASCGCTTPEWTRMPIAPGGKGKVTAIYDPENTPGPFNKTLTVYSNANPKTTILTIRGEVTPRAKTVEDLYTFPVGPVRFESNNLSFTDVKKSEKKTRELSLINTSGASVKVEFDGLPAHLTLKSNPLTLAPGQKGSVAGIYDGARKQGWGHVNDMVRIKINGVVQGNVFLYVSAHLVEDFSKLTGPELLNAPVFKLGSTTFDIGKMKPSAEKEIEFKFTNTGKSDLIIRNITSTCGCTAIQQGTEGAGIKPGESSSIKAVFNSGGYKGKVTKAIYVYTNDPKNSEVILMVNADVE